MTMRFIRRGLDRRFLEPPSSMPPTVSPHVRPPEPAAPLEYLVDTIRCDECATRSKAEQQLRTELADELRKMRFDGGVGSVPDSYFWGITHAERLLRGER